VLDEDREVVSWSGQSMKRIRILIVLLILVIVITTIFWVQSNGDDFTRIYAAQECSETWDTNDIGYQPCMTEKGF
jgi:hypothetical protein